MGRGLTWNRTTGQTNALSNEFMSFSARVNFSVAVEFYFAESAWLIYRYGHCYISVEHYFLSDLMMLL